MTAAAAKSLEIKTPFRNIVTIARDTSLSGAAKHDEYGRLFRRYFKSANPDELPLSPKESNEFFQSCIAILCQPEIVDGFQYQIITSLGESIHWGIPLEHRMPILHAFLDELTAPYGHKVRHELLRQVRRAQHIAKDDQRIESGLKWEERYDTTVIQGALLCLTEHGSLYSFDVLKEYYDEKKLSWEQRELFVVRTCGALKNLAAEKDNAYSVEYFEKITKKLGEMIAQEQIPARLSQEISDTLDSLTDTSRSHFQGCIRDFFHTLRAHKQLERPVLTKGWAKPAARP